MSVKRQALFWLGLLGILVLLLWLLSPILLPFVLGMAVAYFLDPVVQKMENRLHFSRAGSALIILTAFFAVATLLLLALVPVIIAQVSSLIQKLPDYFRAGNELLRPLIDELRARIDIESYVKLGSPLAGEMPSVATLVGGVLKGLLDRGLSFLNSVTLLSIAPLVAFYLLRDWPRVIAAVDGWLPREHAAVIREQIRDIDGVLAGFVRGTSAVCLFLAAFYGGGLSLLGLEYGLTIGLVSGAISFVPYLGTGFGLIASTGLALYQFWPGWEWVVAVLAVFVIGQMIVDYVLTPRWVGDQVGLHPLWVIFALFAWGALFGFLGMLIAVPVTAAIGVLMRFALARYKESRMYLGAAAQAPPQGAPEPAPDAAQGSASETAT